MIAVVRVVSEKCRNTDQVSNEDNKNQLTLNHFEQTSATEKMLKALKIAEKRSGGLNADFIINDAAQATIRHASNRRATIIKSADHKIAIKSALAIERVK